MRLRSLLVVLLLVPLLAAAAGAIYIEGPDAPVYADDEIHIMGAAGTPEGVDYAVMPGWTGGDAGLYVPVVDTKALVTGTGLDTPVAYDTGPIKKYLSDDPNDYVLLPGNEPGMVYALGETVAVPAYAMPALAMPTTFAYAVPAMAWSGPTGMGMNFNIPALSFPVF